MPNSPVNQLLDPLTVSRAESLGLMARYVVEGYMAGEHKSPYRGFAIEFAQHREYTMGDDVRHLDWKVLGRTDRYFIKQYEQETNFVAHLLLDGSQSMQYGSRALTKLDYGKALAACLAYVILQQRDAVALGIFDDKLRDYAPRSDSKGSLHTMLERLAAFEPKAPTNLGAALHDLARQLRRKGIVIVISDFVDDEQAVLEGIQHLRFGGHEVIAFQVLDPHELEFPFDGLVEFEGLEETTKLRTRPAEIRESYLRAVGDFCRRLREGLEKQQCHYVLASTGQPLHEMLSGYLAFRHRTSTR